VSALKTETNTPEMGRRVVAAAHKRFACRHIVADFEHGQWWVTLRTGFGQGSQWSVCDAEGGPAVDGFDFEQITEADT